MPPAISARTAATAAEIGSPAIADKTAATAPSVEAIAATTPTLPERTAVYSQTSPMMLPAPATKSQLVSLPEGREPAKTTNGRTMTNPTAITHASVGNAPSSRLARDEHSIATAQHIAAPNPPRMAIIDDAAPRGGPSQTPAVTGRSRRSTRPSPGRNSGTAMRRWRA